MQATAAAAVNITADDLVIFNRDQMYDGRRRDQEDISPSYYEDPYFKTREAAEKYSNWKDKITPNPNRRKGTPNLFIVGTFHGTITALAKGDRIKFDSAFYAADDIQRKFGDLIYGLGGPYKLEYIQEYLSKAYIKVMKDATGL